MVKLKQHEVVLAGETPQGRIIRLRPMTEDDWDILARWIGLWLGFSNPSRAMCNII